jgi:carbon storage regulator CsrA
MVEEAQENGGSGMLVLSRKTQESVVVGGDNGFEHLVKVTVLEISPGRVKLGFETHKGVPIHRWEVWTRLSERGLLPAVSEPIVKK